MKNFSGSPLHSNNQTPNHIRERNNRKISLLAALPLRFSLRGYGFCMATLFLFCIGSLFYQLNGGPPKILLDIRQYLGKNFIFLLCWPVRVLVTEIIWKQKESCITWCLDALLWSNSIQISLEITKLSFTAEQQKLSALLLMASMCLYVTFLQTDTSMQYTCYEKLHPSNIRFLAFPTPLFQTARNALPFAPCECQFWPIGDVLMTGAGEQFEVPLCYWHLGAHHTPCPLRTTGTSGTRHASVRTGVWTQSSVARLRVDVSITEKEGKIQTEALVFISMSLLWYTLSSDDRTRESVLSVIFSFSRIKCIKIHKVKLGINDLCVHLILYTRQSLQCVCVCVEMRLCCTSSFLRRWLEAVMTR